MEISSGVRTLTLAETFTIAHASSDGERGRVGGAAPRRSRRSRRGRAGRPLRRVGRDVPCVRRRRRRRARRRPVRARGDRGAPARDGRLAGRLLRASNARCTISSASSSGSRRGASSGSRDRTPETTYTIGIDTVDGTADRARRAVEAGFRRLKVKVGGADDLARLRGDPRGDCDLPAAGRRERGLEPRRGPRAAAAARRPRRRADRAAVPGRTTSMLPRAPRHRAAASRDRDRRGLPHAARRRRRSRPTPTASTSSSPRRGGIREASA